MSIGLIEERKLHSMSLRCKKHAKGFTQAGALRGHQRVYTTEKPHECKQCGKCFSRAGHLRIHARLHTGEKPYECKQCGKCFSQAGHLRIHAIKTSHWGEAL